MARDDTFNNRISSQEAQDYLNLTDEAFRYYEKYMPYGLFQGKKTYTKEALGRFKTNMLDKINKPEIYKTLS